MFFGEGVSNGWFNPSVLNPGIHNIYYSFTNDHGCTDTAKVGVRVLALPSASVNVSSLEFCTGASASMSAPSASEWQWMYSGQNIVGATGQNYTATKGGSYQVEVTGTNGCKNQYSSYVIRENSLPDPKVSYTGSPNFCAQSSLELSTGVFSTYQWLRNGEDI